MYKEEKLSKIRFFECLSHRKFLSLHGKVLQKMKKNRFVIFLILICIAIHYNVFAQEDTFIVNQIDSLSKQIELQQPSVERIKTRLSLIDAYRQISHEKATQEGIYALQEAEKLGNDSTLLLAKKKLGTCFLVSGDYDGALKCYGEALELALKMNNKHEMGALKNNTGLIYRNMGMFEEALKYFTEAIDIQESIKSTAVAGTYRNLASIYYMQESYEKYIEISKQLQTFHLKQNDSLEWANATYNIALAYLQWNQISLVLESLYEILPVYTYYEDDANIALVLYMLGYIHVEELKEYKKGLEYLYRSEKYNRLLGLNINLAHCYTVMASAFLKTDSIDKAFKFYERGLDFFSAANHLHGILETYYEMGIAYDNIKKHQEARKYYQLCLNKSKEYNDSRYLIDVHEARIKNAFVLNDSESFFESYDAYVKYVNLNNTELGNLKLDYSKIITENHELRELSAKESDKNTELSKEIVLYRSLASFFGFLTLTLLILFLIFHKTKKTSDIQP